MKALIVLIGLLYVTEAFTQAKPVSMKGQADAAYQLPKQEIQVPFSQYTNLGGLAGLIETGNFNALVNPGGEHSTGGFGWSIASGTLGSTNAFEHSGLKSISATASISTPILTQTVTTNIAELTGQQGVASAWVKHALAVVVQICAIVDNVEVNCVNTVGDASWKEYVIPFVFGSTNYGVRVKALSSVSSGSFYVDDAYVGFMPSSMSPEVAQAQIAGRSSFLGTTNCLWERTSTSFGAFTSDADCPGPVISEQYIGSWQTTDADLPRQTINNLPAGRYLVRASGYAGCITGGECALAISDGTTTCSTAGSATTISSTGAGAQAQPSCIFEYTSSGNRTFEIYGKNTVNIVRLYGVPASVATSFEVYYYPPASKIYSQANNVDTDWVSCGLTTADFTGFGTVSSINDRCKKDGDDLVVDIRFTSGTTTATEARLNLKLQGTALTTVSTLPTLSTAGVMTDTGNLAGSAYALKEASVSYMTFGISASSLPGLAKAQGTSVGASGRSFSINARFPINGWTKSMITGTFANVVTAPGISKPKTCYYGFGGAGSLLSQTACTSGTCTEYYDSCGAGSPPTFSSTGDYASLTFANGTWAASTYMHCSATASGGFIGYVTSTSASNASGGHVVGVRSREAAAGNASLTVSCTGQAP